MKKPQLIIGAVILVVALVGLLFLKENQSGHSSGATDIPASSSSTNPNDPAVKGLNINN